MNVKTIESRMILGSDLNAFDRIEGAESPTTEPKPQGNRGGRYI